MSISKHLARWRSALVALTATVALTACSKNEPGEDDPRDDKAPAAQPHAPGTQDAPAQPHGNHDPAHGGLVMMDATYHVEIVLDTKVGQHRVYVSDGARTALPASTFDEVTLTVAGEELAMTRAADDKAWETTGKPPPTTGAKVSIAYARGGKQVAHFEDLPIEYVITGKMPGGAGGGHHAASGDHAHTAPHGGLVKSTSGGHIELVTGASGKFQVWLLDSQLAVRPIDGASVKIKVAAKDYAEVVAAAVGDHFEGTGAAIPAERPAAVVIATVGSKTETARFELHVEEDGIAGGHGHVSH